MCTSSRILTDNAVKLFIWKTVFLIVGAAQQIRSDDTWEKVVNGVEYLHRTDSTVPWNIHVLKIDLTDPDISLRPILANDSWGPYMETTSSMASRTRALAAINADYSGFTGPPEGTTIIERYYSKYCSKFKWAQTFRHTDLRGWKSCAGICLRFWGDWNCV